MDKLTSNLKERYANQYQDSDALWRELGAIGKVNNILKVTNGAKFGKVLEVGAGEGGILSNLSKAKICDELYAIEISESGINQINKRQIEGLKEVQLFDGYTIPYPDKHFDLVVCTHVLEHVEHPRLLLREIKRVSKQQVFEIPIDFSLNVDKKYKHFLSYGHINIFTPAIFRFIIFTEGFELRADLNNLYSKDVYAFMHDKLSTSLSWKKYTSIKLKNTLRRIFWNFMPKVYTHTKPDTYTCFVAGTDKTLSIF